MEIGQAPYNPTIILKVLLISFLFNISERQTEDVVNENLPAKFFVGLGIDEQAPDHSTLTLFKNRLIENCGIKAYEELFDEIIIIAQEEGINFGKLQIVDSVHTIANVNLIEDERRKQEGKPPRDADACWGAKGNKMVVAEVRKSNSGSLKRSSFWATSIISAIISSGGASHYQNK
jgi:hypothetical protein